MFIYIYIYIYIYFISQYGDYGIIFRKSVLEVNNPDLGAGMQQEDPNYLEDDDE
jgi:hypothetical protein